MFNQVNETIYYCDVAVLVCYVIALLLHIVSMATNNWCEGLLVQEAMVFGLWKGCSKNGDPLCSQISSLLHNLDKGNGWNDTVQILILLSSALLVFKIFLVSCLLLLKRMMKYRKEMVGALISLFALYFILMLLIFIMYAKEMPKHIKKFQLSWSFHMAISAIVLDFTGCLPLLVPRHKNIWRFKVTKNALDASHDRKEATSLEKHRSSRSADSNSDENGFVELAQDGNGSWTVSF